MAKKRKPILLEYIEIYDIGAKGKGVGKAPDGRIVFAPFTAPGDTVDIVAKKKRKSYYEGQAISWHRYSSERTMPKCQHFGICGGCQLQHIRYEKQLYYKAQAIVANIKKISGIENFEIKNPLPSPKVFGYRNKMEYAFTSAKWLTSDEIQSGENFDRRGIGFHVPGHWDKILDIDTCHLQPHPGNDIRNALKNFAKQENISFFHPRERTGTLRQLTLRISRSGEIMLLVHFFENKPESIKKILKFLEKNFPEISSLQYVINPKANDSIYDLEIHLWKGKEHIIEEIGSLKFQIKAKSFFQTNSYQIEQLYEKIKEYAEIQPDDTVFDLYTGTGSIALFVADQAKKIIGIEAVEQAVEDAKINTEINRIDNVEFFQGDMKNLYNEDFIRQHGKPDIIITDPPREGMHEKVIENILKFPPRRIVYVSCNSATQARDLALMKNFYDLRFIQPVDMFPQTYHMENIAILDRKTADQ